MLFVLLLVSILYMFISMTMAVLTNRSDEEKSWFGKAWIVLSCVSVFAMMGIGYSMLNQEKTIVAVSQSSGVEQQSGQVDRQKSQEMDGQYAAESPNRQIAVAVSQQQSQRLPVSYDFLLEVLETLKKGEPIPEQYLQLLSEQDRHKLQNTR